MLKGWKCKESQAELQCKFLHFDCIEQLYEHYKQHGYALTIVSNSEDIVLEEPENTGVETSNTGMTMVCSKECNKLYSNIINTFVEKPAILISGSEDKLYKWGELNTVWGYKKSLEKSGMRNDLKVFDLSVFTVEQQCYIINRMINFVASGFVKGFVDNVINNGNIQWLNEEMQNFNY